MLNIIETPLDGLLVLEPKTFSDNRGKFFESFNHQRYFDIGITKPFVQDNISHSTKNVIRGMHYQIKQPQAKLVNVIKGCVYDVAIDIRRGSPTFGQWYGITLNDENHLQLYIPAGFAHGFCVLSDEAIFSYKCDDYYAPQYERSLRWNDPQFKIKWPINEGILSEKDGASPLFENINPDDLPIYQNDMTL
ncbi:MAG: dTDP-4-dehydrorhamnose 3,5-epimerase [Gammaproteobacteria bacterium]